MRSHHSCPSRALLFSVACALSAAAGCDDDDDDKSGHEHGHDGHDGHEHSHDAQSAAGAGGRAQTSAGAGGASGSPSKPAAGRGGAGGAGGAGGSAAAAKPLYAMNNEIYGADDSTTYVNTLSSLDIERFDSTEGIEFPGGRATIGTVAGHLFVAEPESPVISRFSISESGKLEKDGELSFANYGFTSLTIDDWANVFISPTKAYLFDGATALVWNPETLEIVKEIDQSAHELVREGWSLNGSGAVVRGNRLFRTVFWSDWKAWKSSSDQFLAVYDTESDELISWTSETRCPALGNRVDRDEAGNLYFSNWIWNVPETLLNDAPKSCVLRIAPDSEQFDKDWQLNYAELADGREGAMFAYLGDGKAMMSVFHAERAEVNDKVVPNELASTDNWQLWTIDLDKRTAEPLPGMPWNAGAVSTYRVGDRAFVLLPSDEWSKTNVYEITDEGGSKKFEALGWSYQFLQVR